MDIRGSKTNTLQSKIRKGADELRAHNNSGGSRAPLGTERDADENYFMTCAGIMNGDCFDQDKKDESDTYSYDEYSSDSDSDDI